MPFDYLFPDANSAYLESLGRAREEILGKRASEVFTRVEPDWLSKLEQVVKTKSADPFEMFNQNLGQGKARANEWHHFPGGPEPADS